jgi:uncharacterized protein
MPWEHDGVDVARALSVPQLWILAGADRIAPIRLTQERLDMLQDEGKPIDVVVFPDTDHGIIHFVREPNGTRDYTDFAEGYFHLLADWAKGEIDRPYGAAVFRRQGKR